MKTISMTAFNRPAYLKQTLAGLAANNPKEWHIFISIDPSAVTPEIVSICKAAKGFTSVTLNVNATRKDHRRNQHDAIAMAFTAGSTFNLHLDDDLFIGSDALSLASFYERAFSTVPLTFGSYGLFNYASDPAKPQSIITRKGTFTGLGWCIFPENWTRYFAPHWFDDTYAKRVWNVLTSGWDWNIHGFFREHGIAECFPALSRTNHAGRENGTCCGHDFYDKTFATLPLSTCNEKDFFLEES